MKRLQFFCLVLCYFLTLYGKYSVTDIFAYEYVNEPTDDIIDNSGIIEFYIDSATTPQDFTLASSSIFHSDFQSDGIKQYAFYRRDYFSSVVNSTYFYDVSNVNIYRGFYNQTTSSDLYYFEMAERFDFAQNNECMFYKDNSYTLTFTDFTNHFVIYDNDDMSVAEKFCYFESCDYIGVRGYGYDEKWVTFDDDEIKVDYIFNDESKTYDLRVYINAPFDIYFLRFTIGYNNSDMSGFNQDYMDSSKYSIYQVKGSTSDSKFECVENTSDKGLLKSIIQWLKDIKDSIVNVKDSILDLPNKIASAIKGFFDNVIQALVDLGEFIKGIFIPDSEDLDTIFEEFITFFEEEFGFIFQIEVIIKNFYANVTEQITQEFIEFPKIELNLVGSIFTFGGQKVKIVPIGFENIIISLKKIINFVCTIGFINSCRIKFEKFFGGV